MAGYDPWKTSEKAGCQRVTLPALMQEVQTFIRLAWPETAARTRWMLGFQRRLVFFFDHGTLWPKPGLLPHTSHTAATGVRSHLPLDISEVPIWATGPAYPSLLRRVEFRPPGSIRYWIGLGMWQARLVSR